MSNRNAQKIWLNNPAFFTKGILSDPNIAAGYPVSFFKQARNMRLLENANTVPIFSFFIMKDKKCEEREDFFLKNILLYCT